MRAEGNSFAERKKSAYTLNFYVKEIKMRIETMRIKNIDLDFFFRCYFPDKCF